MPAGTAEPSVLAGLYSFTLPLPAATVMVKPSPETKSVEPSAMVKPSPPALNATATVATPIRMPSGSSTVNLPALVAGSMQTRV